MKGKLSIMQTEETLVSDYENWPALQSEREELARSLLGQHFVAVHDSWIDTARRTLFQGYQPKSPTIQQQSYLDWIENMNTDDRRCALSFIEDVIGGVIFSTLNMLDSNSGLIIKQKCWERIHVSLDIMPRDGQEEGNPLETIDLNGREGVQLHEHWFDWLENYSKDVEDVPT